MKRKRIEPGPGQESVWDYPRPPKIDECRRRVRVVFNGQVIAESTRAKRVLETSHPPGIYVPPEDIKPGVLTPSGRTSACEWKGRATYHHINVEGRTSLNAAWSYETPVPAFQGIQGYVTFYPGRVDDCFLDEERVTPQEGDFYGGWMTAEVVGPFKGSPGTWGW